MKTAVYPGSFDPITLGHLDIIERASRCFDKLYVCVMLNADKRNPMFTPDERLQLVRASIDRFPNVEAEIWSGLLVDYTEKKDASLLVKGVRNVTDFDMEYQMSLINASVRQDLDTVFFPASAEYIHFSSSMAREMVRYGQPLEKYLPAEITAEVERLSREKNIRR